MNSRFVGEKLITLAQARVRYKYTADHLAYLCRSDYIWAERQGKIWLTCSHAIEEYQQTLLIAGKPIKVQEQPMLLEDHDEAQKPENGGRRYIENGSDSGRFTERDLLRVLPLPATGRSNPDLLKFDLAGQLFAENAPRRVEERKKENLWTRYQEIFARRNPAFALSHPRASWSGFTASQAPYSLPQASVPDYIQFVPWYRETLVAAPAMAICILALSVLQLAGFSPEMRASIEVSSSVLSSASTPFSGLIAEFSSSLQELYKQQNIVLANRNSSNTLSEARIRGLSYARTAPLAERIWVSLRASRSFADLAYFLESLSTPLPADSKLVFHDRPTQGEGQGAVAGANVAPIVEGNPQIQANIEQGPSYGGGLIVPILAVKTAEESLWNGEVRHFASEKNIGTDEYPADILQGCDVTVDSHGNAYCTQFRW